MEIHKKSKFKDERLANLKNKIYAEIYILVMVIIGISTVAKYFIYDMGIQGITTELAIAFISGVYYTYRSTRLGVISAEVEMHDRESKWTRQKKNLFTGIILGILIALFFGINSAVQYAEGPGQRIYYFSLVSIVSLMIYLPLFLVVLVLGNDILKKKSDKAVNKMLDADESGDRDEKY